MNDERRTSSIMAEDDSIRERARHAYRRSALFERFVPAQVAVLLLAFGLFASTERERLLPFGALVVLLAVLSAWLGAEVRRFAVPALVAGAVPFVCALFARRVAHACFAGACMEVCVAVCATAGLAAGLALGRLLSRRSVSKETALFTVLLGGALGVAGCSCVGLAGVAGMTLGLISGTSLAGWAFRPVGEP